MRQSIWNVQSDIEFCNEVEVGGIFHFDKRWVATFDFSILTHQVVESQTLIKKNENICSPEN